MDAVTNHLPATTISCTPLLIQRELHILHRYIFNKYLQQNAPVALMYKNRDYWRSLLVKSLYTRYPFTLDAPYLTKSLRL